MYVILTILWSLGACTNQGTESLKTTDTNEEKFIENLLSKMSLEEKLGQLNQRGTSSREKGKLSEELKQAVRNGNIGSMLNVMNHNNLKELQKIAVEESPNGIPLLFARDVIHGFRTIFPIPLGQAASWDANGVKKAAEVAAKEASSQGIRWTFAPMIDISRDPRWGRIAESFGEDPYLTSVLGNASIDGFQGDLTKEYNIAACAKHFAGYGAAEGGRDYNATYIPEPTLRQVYLAPFKSAVNAGALTFMAGFNALNGIPVSGNKWLLNNVLREEWNFDGTVVSDWNSVTEMIPHGYAPDKKQAAVRAIEAGVDMEMTSDAYAENLENLLEEKVITIDKIDEAVRRILRVKYRLGLFDTPFADLKEINSLPQEYLAIAKEVATKSIVLLKNENNVLPILNNQKVALIGPLADAPLDQLGTWIFDGKKEESITLLTAATTSKSNTIYFEKALNYSRDKIKSNFKQAIKKAKKADIIVLAVGEEAILSGEAHSRSNLKLPGVQEELLQELSKLNKPIVLVLMAGRPLIVNHLLEKVDAVVMGWHAGTMAGPAIWDVLTGVSNPSGRLPITWPKATGQVPMYYNHTNTGRPATDESVVLIDEIPVEAWQSSLGNTSHYLEIGRLPQWPFGFGLSYSNVSYSALTVSKKIQWNGTVKASVKVKNLGKYSTTETVQLYIQDEVAELVQPVKVLKGFQQVQLGIDEEKTIHFELPMLDLAYIGPDMKPRVDAGKFKLWLAPNSGENNPYQHFELIEK
ncbi:beta-glucosidase BglX [Flammeovirga kamogawensis]|uniref:beta-glucosidase n=2 Tax=Flammeovirga kamogawensis TaxID=373891 RepID=A0ABX8H3Y5_9BACT|nr:beta-glucosidase BglX [Flammeovirga kamogawensis]TRX65670.1 beta-glucosidase BglX [Flammeovirga kamogawensis]